jgi:Zn-dependent M28 family amino/carboxypeptidase
VDAYKQTIASGGTNLVGVLPGSDLANEYVVVGAHYDGLGTTCRGSAPADSICNGATDNATGAAIVLDILRAYAVSGTQPRRSIVFAFWDREEDGLRGSAAYTASPLVPIADTVAYVNFDVQGADLRPSGASSTFAIGAETGGPVLSGAVADAAAPGTLDTWLVSLIFGQGRSDHTNFINAGVPSVFFSDSTGPCYHTVDDEAEIVDFDKLEQQSLTARRLVIDLASRDDTPTLTTGLPLATYEDAITVQTLLDRLMADLGTLAPAQQTAFLTHRATVAGIVAAGPGAFDNTAMINMLLATSAVVNDILTSGPCLSFIPNP